jgi:hypothetical protein
MYSVRSPRTTLCAPLALGEAAIVRRGGDVIVRVRPWASRRPCGSQQRLRQ